MNGGWVMELRLLGPVEIVVGRQVYGAGPLRHRSILAVLAIAAGSPVSVESLIDRVWDEPPAYPRRALQVYISRIRRGEPPVDVVRRSGGYLLDLDPGQVDVHQFRRLAARARHPDCPPRERVDLLGRALGLWRGLPLPDLESRWAGQIRQSWVQRYLETVTAWAQAGLLAGDPVRVLPRLRELTAEHPLAESLAAAYMRVLYAAGRRAEALSHYITVRHRLADDLGADPGTELQRVHRQILTADPLPARTATAC